MITLEQAKRLKVVGYPVDKRGYYQSFKGEDFPDPTEKDLMEWLVKQVDVRITIYNRGICWYIDVGNMTFSSADITEALFMAVESICRKEKRN